MLLPGKAGGAVAVRRTLASTICRIADPTQVPRPRQLRDASTVMRFRPAHQSMINRRFDDRASCPARKSPKQALASKPRIHSPASWKGGHESGSNLTFGTRAGGRLGVERRASRQISASGKWLLFQRRNRDAKIWNYARRPPDLHHGRAHRRRRRCRARPGDGVRCRPEPYLRRRQRSHPSSGPC